MKENEGLQLRGGNVPVWRKKDGMEGCYGKWFDFTFPTVEPDVKNAGMRNFGQADHKSLQKETLCIFMELSFTVFSFIDIAPLGQISDTRYLSMGPRQSMRFVAISNDNPTIPNPPTDIEDLAVRFESIYFLCG